VGCQVEVCPARPLKVCTESGSEGKSGLERPPLSRANEGFEIPEGLLAQATLSLATIARVRVPDRLPIRLGSNQPHCLGIFGVGAHDCPSKKWEYEPN
jgi:hypothetical protein